jgi:cell division protein FtsI (penicillin-binding protein 3)
MIDRLKMIAFLGVGFALLLAFRLASLQVWSVDAYAVQARNQHIKKRVLQASRGRIFDRHGRVLATNLESQSFFLNRISDLDSLRTLAVKFSQRAGRDETTILKKLDHSRSFVWLARKIIDGPTAEELPDGVGRIVEMKRSYPMGSLAGQVLGYTDTESKGIEGIERAFDPLLRGLPGELSARVDARGNVLSTLGAVRQMPKNGDDLKLTIDADYQAIAEEELLATVREFNAHSGIAIVMEPHTGEILAMANAPYYDPNDFVNSEAWIRRNRSVTDQFEPGSTFKIVAVAAALESEIISPDDSIFCENGKLPVAGGQVIRDTHPNGWLTVREIVEKSSNIGIVKIARKLDKGPLFRQVRLFGFGTKTGADLPGEVAGYIRHPDAWSKRSLETIAIGQELAATALQVASAYGAIANGGLLMTPRIFHRASQEDSTTVEGLSRPIRQVISPETARVLINLLEGVVIRGTGSNARVPGYRVAGKTGTAQQVKEGQPGYDPDRYVSSFIGFLPAERPELLCLVAVDRPSGIHWASRVAAPTFSRIVQRILGLRQTPLRHRAPLVDGYPPPPARVDIHLTGLPRETAIDALKRVGMTYQIAGEGDRVVAQHIDAEKNKALLFLSSSVADSLRVPDVTGAPLRQAVVQLTQIGLRVKISGSGRVVEQSPKPGEHVEPGTVCRVECKRES